MPYNDIGYITPLLTESTKEDQYSILFDVVNEHGVSNFGLMANESWNNDPKRTLFTLSRYKFVSRLLAGYTNVLEVGCADAFGTRIVLQSVRQLTAVDFDPVFINDIRNRYNPKWPFNYFEHDMLSGPVDSIFDAIYCLDVLEHIHPNNEHLFISNCLTSLAPNGVFIAGIPSLESQTYASPQSKQGHVNCKTAVQLKSFLQSYFNNVFIFSMNDEVIHTGFYPMAHYLFALCCSPRL